MENKTTDIISQLKTKYNLAPNSYYTQNPYSNTLINQTSAKEIKLRKKWAARVPPGWYGISVGLPAPEVWFDVLDEFLDWVVLNNKDFEIWQIKCKFGEIVVYLNKINEEARAATFELSGLLTDKYLVY